MTSKKIIGSILLISILTLSATGAAFASSGSSQSHTKTTSCAITQQGHQTPDQDRKNNGMGFGMMSTEQLKTSIASLSQSDQAKILALQETLTATMEKEQAAKEALNTALSNAGIAFPDRGNGRDGGFGMNSDAIKAKISALSESQQTAIATVQKQMQDLRKEEMTAMGITMPEKIKSTTESGVALARPEKPERATLTDAQKAIEKEYQAKIDTLAEKLHTLLEDAGITMPTPPAHPKDAAAN